jgi:hypothetical protein
MKSLLIVTLALAPAWGQALDFNLDAVAAKAKEKAEVTLEGPLLEQAMKNAPDKLKDKVGNLSRVVVRHYEFDKPGQFAESDLDNVRKVVSSSPGWARIINVKEEKESVEIYMQSQGGKTSGFLLIAAEQKELTVVHIVGTIDLASLQEVVKSTIAYDLSTAGAPTGGH